MGNKILISNIGTRNLICKQGEDYVIIENATTFYGKELKSKTFLEKTKEIEEIIKEFPEALEDLELNIINLLIHKVQEAIGKIILFVSDQSKTGKGFKVTNNDTWIAGKLINDLIPVKFPNLQGKTVEIITLECSVVNNDELIRKYRTHFNDFLEQVGNNQKFIICDSGGTPQQKASLKITAEYIFKEKTVEYFRIYEDRNELGILKQEKVNEYNPKNVQPLPEYEYRNIIDQQHILTVIKYGNYDAALNIFTNNNNKEQSPFSYILQILSLRKRLLTENAKEIFINSKSQGKLRVLRAKKYFKSIFDFHTMENKADIEIYNFIGWKDCFNNPKSFLVSIEALAVADFYYKIEDWTGVVLATQIFIEKTLLEIKKCISISGRDNNKNFGKRAKYLKGKAQDLSIPILENFANQIITLHSETNGATGSKPNSFNHLRNGITHEGKGIKYLPEILVIAPNFDTFFTDWKRKFGLATNPYIQANQEIKNYLYKTPKRGLNA